MKQVLVFPPLHFVSKQPDKQTAVTASLCWQVITLKLANITNEGSVFLWLTNYFSSLYRTPTRRSSQTSNWTKIGNGLQALCSCGYFLCPHVAQRWSTQRYPAPDSSTPQTRQLNMPTPCRASPCEGLTSAASIHQTMEVFPCSAL